MLYANGFKASIAIDGQRVPHYGIQLDEAKKEMTCWIVGTPGQKFAVHWACCTNDMGPSRGDVHLNRVKLGCEYIKTPNWNLNLEERKKALAVWKSQTAGSEDLAFPDQEIIQEKEIQLRVYHLTKGVPRRIRDDKTPPNNALRQLLPGELDTTMMMRQITFIFKYLSQEELEAKGIAKIDSATGFNHTLLRASHRVTGINAPTAHGSPSASPNHFLSAGPDAKRKREIEFAETVPHTDEELRAEMADLKQRLKELELLLSYRKRVNKGGRVRVPKNVPFERPRSDWYRYPGTAGPMHNADDMEPSNSKKRKIEMGEGGSSSGN